MTARKRAAWVLGLGLLVAVNACLLVDDDTASAEAACAQACDCLAAVPSQQAGCRAECNEFAPQLAPVCLDCLAGLDCPDLARGACEAECGIAAQQLIPPQENE